MRTISGWIVCIVAAVALATPAKAVPITFGPVLDGFGDGGAVPFPPVVILPTFLGIDLDIFGVKLKIGIKDEHAFRFLNHPGGAVILFSYVTVDSSPLLVFNPVTDSLVLTDITAFALGGPADLLGTGFDPVNPQAVQVGLPVFIGRSGAIYTPDVNVASSLANLSALLPGFDLTGFSGNPDSIVYVSQFTVPASDAAAPEPGTLALLALGLIGLNLVRRKALP